MALKSIPVDYAYVHLLKGEQSSPEHVALNPSGTVPVFTHLVDNGPSFPIGQSIAALEYIEEIFPDKTPLLPPRHSPLERAKVRSLVNIIACDTQPITNRHVMLAVGALGGSPDEWSKKYMTRGLEAYEQVSSKTTGRYSVGDNVTLADVCLIPAVWGAERYGVELGKLPTVMKVYGAMMELEAVKKAHWKVQRDTPSDLAWL
ncbi:hypothetical protein LTR66_005960 [Elasticomyces elasticus]|nr:hypothetical protein LTR66_005960 [Elasticomyces elasticus]KAK5007525.1 hypothetical protein LTR28_005175 [Elasticomyces elasticus]